MNFENLVTCFDFMCVLRNLNDVPDKFSLLLIYKQFFQRMLKSKTMTISFVFFNQKCI